MPVEMKTKAVTMRLCSLTVAAGRRRAHEIDRSFCSYIETLISRDVEKRAVDEELEVLQRIAVDQ
jgi:hypothetical protein